MKKTVFSFLLLLTIPIHAQFTIPISKIEYAKNNIENIPNGKAALKSLIFNANKQLGVVIVPVTEKKILAISGDKHDYVSMGPYWWPNPKTADGLPYIRKDGQRNPEITNLDRPKVDLLTKSITTLGYAYYFTGDEKYAIKAVNDLKLFFVNKETRMNPNLNYGQMIPGHNGGKGRAEGLIDVYSFVPILNCVQLLSSSKAMKEADLKALKSWFSEFLDWMLTSEVGLAENSALNNHGMAFDVEATTFAVFCGRKEVAESIVDAFPKKRLFTQIEPDGSQPLELVRTIALHYSIFNIIHAMDLCELAKSMGKDVFLATSKDGRSITKAIEFIRPYLGKPQSLFPYSQIKEWNENQQKLCWVLRRATLFVPNAMYDEQFETYCKTKSIDLDWILYSK